MGTQKFNIIIKSDIQLRENQTNLPSLHSKPIDSFTYTGSFAGSASEYFLKSRLLYFARESVC